jgi:hypothetical protein
MAHRKLEMTIVIFSSGLRESTIAARLCGQLLQSRMDLKDCFLQVVKFTFAFILRHQDRGRNLAAEFVGNCHRKFPQIRSGERYEYLEETSSL